MLEVSGMCISVDSTDCGEIPVINPKMMYEGNKAKAFILKGKRKHQYSTIAGMRQRIVPSKALVHTE